MTGNSARYGKGASGGPSAGVGGGLSIDPTATVYLDTFTLNHTKNNKPNDISGSYEVVT